MNNLSAYMSWRAIVAATFVGVSSLYMTAAGVDKLETSTFEAGKNTFLLNGEPFVVKAAELHYPRIPREYWDHRIKMCKALGMNTVCLYVFWNVHESEPGKFDFTGQNDLAEFVRLCRANGMYVILRPGPYVCAEWEMGGLPWWLLQKKDIALREPDPYFMERVALFEEAVAREVAPLTVDKGGPIIMVQVENEYGSYGENKPYVAAIRDMLRRLYGDEVTLFQCDWSSNFLLNGLDDLVWTMNFGTGADIDREFAPLKEARPDSPLMCSEYWSGWFDKWGANHETRPADEMIAGIGEMLDKDISFSLYMTHGGTNWGHWAGANSPGFAPDVTSYDYDAPISESGRTTPKYHMLRELLARHVDGGTLPPIPDSIPTEAIQPFTMTEFVPLADIIASVPSRRDSVVRTMEEYGQGFGSIMYSAVLPAMSDTVLTLTVAEPHDYARVYVGGEYAGALDRRNGERILHLPQGASGKPVDILVEGMGRINFGRAIKDFKGITDSVIVSDGVREMTLEDWTVRLLPDEKEFYDSLPFHPVKSAAEAVEQPGCYRGAFTVDSIGDTFLDFSRWGKGLVYVNGHPIGRFWEIGPQQTLYMPGCWLRKGENEIVVFDIIGPLDPIIKGRRGPIIDMLRADGLTLHRLPGQTLDLSGVAPVSQGEFHPGAGWQEVKFDAPARGRYFCLEALDGFGEDDVTSVAELYLLDGNGQRLPREAWSVVYADSEDARGNHTADKAFDLQESTCWTTAAGDKYPHSVVIDLGGDYTVGSMQYLPRMGSGTPGAVRRYRAYVSPSLFKM